MTTISALNGSSNTAATTSSSKSSALGQDQFLTLLVAQLQNQDPMNPIDSADYAVQLATFSGVEQQVRTNQLLADMQGKFSQRGFSEPADWANGSGDLRVEVRQLAMEKWRELAPDLFTAFVSRHLPTLDGSTLASRIPLAPSSSLEYWSMPELMD